MKNNPLISVVIPTYNSEKTLARRLVLQKFRLEQNSPRIREDPKENS
jgi:GT2 family glycosyltransferase